MKARPESTHVVDECQDQPVAMPATAEDNAVVPEIRELLREAIDESGWKHDALWEVLGLPDRFYLSKMLSGEKPIGAKHLAALPDEIEALFAKKYAQAFGLIVVEPISGPSAAEALVAGLIGLVTTMGSVRLPSKASAMAKASLAMTPAKKVVAR